MAVDDGYVELSEEQRAAIAKVHLPTGPRGPGDRSLLAWAARADAEASLVAFTRSPKVFPGIANLVVQLATTRITRGPLPLVASPMLLQAVVRWYAQVVLDLYAQDDGGRSLQRALGPITPLEAMCCTHADLWVRLMVDPSGQVRIDPNEPPDDFSE